MPGNDPHPGIDHPGEWRVLIPERKWIRYLRDGEYEEIMGKMKKGKMPPAGKGKGKGC